MLARFWGVKENFFWKKDVSESEGSREVAELTGTKPKRNKDKVTSLVWAGAHLQRRAASVVLRLVTELCGIHRIAVILFTRTDHLPLFVFQEAHRQEHTTGAVMSILCCGGGSKAFSLFAVVTWFAIKSRCKWQTIIKDWRYCAKLQIHRKTNASVPFRHRSVD